MTSPPEPGTPMVPLAFAKEIAHRVHTHGAISEIDSRLDFAAVSWPATPTADHTTVRTDDLADILDFALRNMPRMGHWAPRFERVVRLRAAIQEVDCG